jgi:hypothetical protein
MIVDPKRKPHQDDGDSDKRNRQEEALDEALENTFPASDPVSVEQPTTSGRACRSRAEEKLMIFRPNGAGNHYFSQADEVLRRDTGYHACPLGADIIAAAARIPFLAHRHSVVAAHGRVAAERDNNTDLGP